ncbi:MAG: hypothetical protein, partial [Olavius algarvensis Delta 4 endosymbiont]
CGVITAKADPLLPSNRKAARNRFGTIPDHPNWCVMDVVSKSFIRIRLSLPPTAATVCLRPPVRRLFISRPMIFCGRISSLRRVVRSANGKGWRDTGLWQPIPAVSSAGATRIHSRRLRPSVSMYLSTRPKWHASWQARKSAHNRANSTVAGSPLRSWAPSKASQEPGIG